MSNIKLDPESCLHNIVRIPVDRYRILYLDLVCDGCDATLDKAFSNTRVYKYNIEKDYYVIVPVSPLSEETKTVDRIEKLTIKRTLSATVVKLVVIESGITVDYSIKTYESQIPESIRIAKERTKAMLKLAQEA